MEPRVPVVRSNLAWLLVVLSVAALVATLLVLRILNLAGWSGAYWFVLVAAAAGWANFFVLAVKGSDDA